MISLTIMVLQSIEYSGITLWFWRYENNSIFNMP